ncbi:MAG: lysophospholipid acyltransferase family protein [bacterium]|nr:lysophospholipid acyltransferase family protein [bacterium]
MLRRTLFPLLLRRIRVEGIEQLPRPPFIIVANHNSYLDAPMIGASLATRFGQKSYWLTHAKITRFFGPLIGIRWLGMIPVPHDGNKAKVLEISAEKINQGNCVGIFPEGHRNFDSQKLRPAKTGAVRLACLTGAPIVPTGIISPPTITTGQALRTFFLTDTMLGVRFGEPIHYPKRSLEGVTKNELEQMTKEVMIAVGRLCHKSYPYAE